MGPKRKVSGEGGTAVVVISTSHAEQLQRGTMGGVGLRLRARRELLQQMRPQYRMVPPARKRELLEAFTQITGYHRKYAIWLLNQTEETLTSGRQARPRRYGTDVQEALIQIWKKTNRICTFWVKPLKGRILLSNITVI